jgi:cellobiose phosphorylase
MLYLNLSGDMNFLLEEQTYFKDKHIGRSSATDSLWHSEDGNSLRNEAGEIHTGSILEHILLQNLIQFFNVGEHNNIRMEGADWNDAFDMARDKGESVAFTALYASNLKELSQLVKELGARKGIEQIHLVREIKLLMDSLTGRINYDSVEEKRKLLEQYYATCKHTVSGERVGVDIAAAAMDLAAKADWMMEHIRKQEWVRSKDGQEWFNGYYNNDGEKVDGDHPNGTRMTLTGQVFTVMGGTATEEQTVKVVKAVKNYLKDPKIGYRLNSNFGGLQLNIGRGFGFAFGHKENGAMFSHMSAMYSNALYKRGFVKDAYDVLHSIYSLCRDFETSRIYPGIPEYINQKGRGMYQYLTGSASWLLLTLLTEVYGIKGSLGDLSIEPKLMKEQFDAAGTAAVTTMFAGRRLNIILRNKELLEYGDYRILEIRINDREVSFHKEAAAALLRRSVLEGLDQGSTHEVEVLLGT